MIILLLKTLIERRLIERAHQPSEAMEEKNFEEEKEEEKKEIPSSNGLFTRPEPDEILISALLEINNWSARNDGIEKLVPPILNLERIATERSSRQLGEIVHTALVKLRSEHRERWIPLPLEAYAAWHQGDNYTPLFR